MTKVENKNHFQVMINFLKLESAVPVVKDLLMNNDPTGIIAYILLYIHPSCQFEDDVYEKIYTHKF